MQSDARQPDWYKDAIIYEIPIRAFFDSNADGIGDFRGLIERLDYVKELGVTAVWLLPFYPSPLRDGGYDIADYRKVASMYGTMRDFRRFLDAAHERDIRVITELVINHTSDQHEWFQRARKSPPGSRWRNFYVWTDDPTRYQDARIIFQDYEASNWTWDPVAQAYFWHRFYSHQPDLNFDNPEVREAVLDTCGFWLKMGVDGMRLDAIPYLYERDGTNCENLPETHAFLKELRAYIDANFDDRMLLAEANQWPEDAAEYFGEGDECQMNFHFPLMPRMFMSVQVESSAPIHDILAQTPPIPDNCQWALFLRNHDELTLEMVTDEDRDFMYDAYASDPQMRVNLGIRRRLAPLLRTRRRIELMNALLFSMPGTPVLYYGDEIGMGDNIYLGDRDAVRTPMQWSADRNGGFSKANPQKLYLPTVIDPEYHHASVNVEAQEANPESLLSWTKHIIQLRREHPVFGRGDIELLQTSNGKVLAFYRRDAHEKVLVVANLSRHSQYVELDLSEFAGWWPTELFGGVRFPQIGELPYLLTLGPHGYHWFLLEDRAGEEDEAGVPKLSVKGARWASVLEGKNLEAVQARLKRWLPHRRWYRGKSRELASTKIVEKIALSAPTTGADYQLAVVEARYRDSELARTRYLVPLGFETGEAAATRAWQRPHSLIAELTTSGEQGVLYDAADDAGLAHALLDLALGRKKKAGPLRGRPTKQKPSLDDPHALSVRSSEAEQSNTSLLFGDALMLKLFRVLEAGPHPEVELGRFLNEAARFEHTPDLYGSVQHVSGSGEEPRSAAIAVVHQLVPHQGDGWELTVDAAARALERAYEMDHEGRKPPSAAELKRPVEQSEVVQALLGAYGSVAARLGERTGELHLALTDDALSPQRFTLLHQRELYQAARARMRAVFGSLRKHRKALSGRDAELAEAVLSNKDALDARLKRIYAHKIEAERTRIHGDLHLGQILVVGGDLFFIDFEGEPVRTLKDRRRPRTPLRDVAGMLRSFRYAMESALRQRREGERELLEPWGEAWSVAVERAFMQPWADTVKGARFLPDDEAATEVLLDFHLLAKCIYEVGYELDNRPDWLGIPLRSLQQLLGDES